jgi:cell division protein FtsQ
VARRKDDGRAMDEAGGLWHQPALMNLLADLLIVLASAGLAWAALTALQRLPLFPLRELVLTQLPGKVTSEQLEHTARTTVTGNFFTVDLEAARSAFEKLPWVRKATVQRQWPGSLALTIEEHEAMARWQHPNGMAALVNRQGELFSAELPDNGGALPLFSGPESSAADILNRHAQFSAALAGIGRQVATVSLSPRLAWQIRLDDGMVVELGRDQEPHPLIERLARFSEHYAALRKRVDRLQVADMRYPNGFVASGSTLPGSPRPTATAGRKS